MLLAILNNVGMLALAAFGLLWVMRLRVFNLQRFRPILLGVLLGLAAFLVTANPVTGPFGASLDGRAGPILFAGYLGGPVAGLLAAFAGAAARYAIGGPLVVSGVLVFFVYAFAGVALARFQKRRASDLVGLKEIGQLAFISFVSAGLMTFFIDGQDARINWVANNLPLVLLANLLSVLVVGLAFRFASEEARHAAAAERMRERLELAARSSAMGIWDYDVASGEVSWDERQCRLHGIPPGCFGGGYDDWAARVHPDDRLRVSAEFAAALAGEADYDTELRIIRPDGGVRHLKGAAIILRDARGRPRRVVGVNYDLTPLRESQRAIEDNEARFAAMAANLPGVLFRMKRHSPGDFRFDYVSPGCRELVEHDAEELVRDSELFMSMMSDEDRTELAARLVESAKRMEPALAEFSIRTPSGAIKHLQCIARPETQLDEMIIWHGVTLDVTARAESERELARNRELFHQAQRLDAVGKLSGGIAHDFNNLLGVIQGNAELLADDMPEGRPRRALEDMVRATERAAELTSQLLSFSRRAPLSPRVIAVDESLEEMRSLIARTLPESIRLEVRPAGTGIVIKADPAQLGSALLNLVLNARDAMPDGGVLTLDAAAETLSAEDLRDGEEVAPGAYVRLSVVDSGVGMTEEVRERALEPFFTTKEIGEGSGMGLAMVSGFVRQSGGFMRLDSAPGEGARVSVFFPRAQAAAPAKDAVTDAPQVGAGRILLVEDNAALRDTLLRQIDSLGYDAVGAEDGDVALALLDAGERFDLVLTDMVMPGPVQGPALADEVRRRRPGLPVLLMSGYADLGGEGEAWPSRIDLPKPIRMKTLADALKAALETARAE